MNDSTPNDVANEIMERIKDVWDDLVDMPEAAAMVVIAVAATKPVRAAIASENKRCVKAIFDDHRIPGEFQGMASDAIRAPR
jgi:hypothetical protein